tara:strand:- start:1078 stop:2565 length:1488 start_codon:yes stop_codon:yes gene_type:complete
MDYKYKTTFECPISVCEISKASLISEASLSNLAPLVPKNIDYKSNVDLLGVAFNAAVVNKFNRNGDGMSTSTAIEYTPNFIHKPTNIEHNKQKIVGHIVDAGFSDIKTNKILNAEDIKNKKNSFNIALGAVIYKSVNKDFTNLVQRSLDPDDPAYQKVSASWEVGFSNFVLAVGSDNLEDAKIISDPEKIAEMKGFLRSYGGTGKTDKGENIYRLITGKIYPLGIAYTMNPAANVKGLYSDKPDTEKIFINDKRDKISQNLNLNVKNEKDINAMEIEKTISELKELLNEKKFSQEAIASMTDTFSNAIKERDEKYRADIEEAKKQKELIAKEYEDLKTSVADLEQKLGEANERISVFENEKKAEEAIARFNERMDSIDESYDLDDEDREFLANELKDLGEDAEFTSFASKLEVLWRHKNKEAQASIQEEIQKRIDEEVAKRVSNASEEVEVEKVFDEAEVTDSEIPNANEAVASDNKSLIERFKEAFKRENIEIS